MLNLIRRDPELRFALAWATVWGSVFLYMLVHGL
jgi:hypothetical protein